MKPINPSHWPREKKWGLFVVLLLALGANLSLNPETKYLARSEGFNKVDLAEEAPPAKAAPAEATKEAPKTTPAAEAGKSAPQVDSSEKISEITVDLGKYQPELKGLLGKVVKDPTGGDKNILRIVAKDGNTLGGLIETEAKSVCLDCLNHLGAELVVANDKLGTALFEFAVAKAAYEILKSKKVLKDPSEVANEEKAKKEKKEKSYASKCDDLDDDGSKVAVNDRLDCQKDELESILDKCETEEHKKAKGDRQLGRCTKLAQNYFKNEISPVLKTALRDPRYQGSANSIRLELLSRLDGKYGEVLAPEIARLTGQSVAAQAQTIYQQIMMLRGPNGHAEAALAASNYMARRGLGYESMFLNTAFSRAAMLSPDSAGSLYMALQTGYSSPMYSMYNNLLGHRNPISPLEMGSAFNFDMYSGGMVYGDPLSQQTYQQQANNVGTRASGRSFVPMAPTGVSNVPRYLGNNQQYIQQPPYAGANGQYYGGSAAPLLTPSQMGQGPGMMGGWNNGGFAPPGVAPYAAGFAGGCGYNSQFPMAIGSGGCSGGVQTNPLAWSQPYLGAPGGVSPAQSIFAPPPMQQLSPQPLMQPTAPVNGIGRSAGR